MISPNELSGILAALYSAPLEPEQWQVFFDRLAQATKVSNGFLFTMEEGQAAIALAGGGFAFDPGLNQQYNEHYHQVDPFVPAAMRKPGTAVIPGEELVERGHLLKSEVYNEVMCRHEMEFMTLLSFAEEGRRDFMSMWRRAKDGPMDAPSMALLNILLPHAHTAIRLHARMKSAAVQSHLAELALEAMVTAAFLVSCSGCVVHMNGLAQAMVNTSGALRMEGVLLTAQNPAESEHLELLIASAAGIGGKKGQHAPGGALTVSRAGNDRPLNVAVLPVPPNCRVLVGVPCALVFANDPSAAPKSRAAVLRDLYALTPSEARLADLLMQGLEVREAAGQLRVTLETARFQLKRVLSKTGTHRQTALMRLMLLLPGNA